MLATCPEILTSTLIICLVLIVCAFGLGSARCRAIREYFTSAWVSAARSESRVQK
jgi:hypothetical protein